MTEFECPECEQTWNNARSAETCCTDDGLTGYSPSKSRISYTLSYD